MGDWIAFLKQAKQRGETAIVITVAETKGSVPRDTGTKMIVTENDVHGTIGGGHLEYKTIDIAKNMILEHSKRALGQNAQSLTPALSQTRERVRNAEFTGVNCGQMSTASDARAMHRFVLGATLGQCCGGVMNLAFEATAADAEWLEPVAAAAPDFHLVLFGAGHVGRVVVKVLSELSCAITWVDSRQDEFPKDIPANVQCVCTFDPECEIDAASAGSYFLVMTHSHALDQVLSERILRRADFAYFGLIGSLTKRRQFERRLQDRGISAAQLAGMSCPIGAAGIYGKEPATIAIAVAAEILQRRSKLECTESLTTRIAS